MEEIRFEVRHPDGRRERLVVHGSRATIGAGAHCDVRLAIDQAALEHVLVEVVPEGLSFQGVARSPGATLDGAPLTRATVPQWGLLKIGDTQVHAARALREASTATATPRSTVLVRVACAVVAPAALAMMFFGRRDAAETGTVELPNLFAAMEASCPRTEPSEARVLGEDQRAIADAARERSPFAPREAVTAAKAYTVAAACLRLAGDKVGGDEAEQAANELRDGTVTELRARRLRLEHSLALNDYELASTDAEALARLTEGEHGPFVVWLGGVQRELVRQGAGGKR